MTALFGALVSSHAGEPQVAWFDASSVFARYEHVQQINVEVKTRIHTSWGRASDPPEIKALLEIEEHQRVVARRVTELEGRTKTASASAERERLGQELAFAKLTRDLDLEKLKTLRADREIRLKKETDETRASLLAKFRKASSGSPRSINTTSSSRRIYLRVSDFSPVLEERPEPM